MQYLEKGAWRRVVTLAAKAAAQRPEDGRTDCRLEKSCDVIGGLSTAAVPGGC
jgi:hypothetical protein